MQGKIRTSAKRVAATLTLALLAGTATVSTVYAQEAAPAAAESPSAALPVIKIIATGGTIANTPDGRIAVDAIINELPEVQELADIRVEDVTRVGSSSLTWKEFIDTAKAVERTLAEEPEVDGIVVTIGSNTSEDMAYFLNLVIKTDKPIVVTAAQRQRTTRSEDSSRNFIDALITAGTEETGGKGVVLVANELINPARTVTKNIVSRVDTWQSLDTGALGIISDGEAVFYNQPLRRHTMDSEFSLDGIEQVSDLPKVEILYSYVGASGELVDAAVKNGAEGIVVAAFATGAPSREEQGPALEAVAATGTAVVIGNRGSSGRVPPDNGEFIGADNLSPQKALILLMMGLTVTKDVEELKRIFSEY